MNLRSLSGLVMILSTLLLGACGGSDTESRDAGPGGELSGATAETVRKEPPLQEKFSNLLISQITASQDITTSYPTVLDDLKSSLIGFLETKNLEAKKYRKTGMKDAGQYPGSTVLVEISIPDMRIVSTSARVWLGGMTGTSYMNVHVRLTDAATGRLVHEKTVNTYVSSFAASYSFGANDRSLVDDMGKIVGEYLVAIIPGE